MDKRKRRLAVPLVLIALSLVFIINGVFFSYSPEPIPTNTNNPGTNTVPTDFFRVPEVPGTLIPLILSLSALFFMYWKR